MIGESSSNVDSLKSSNKKYKDVYIAVQLSIVIVFFSYYVQIFCHYQRWRTGGDDAVW